MKVEANLQSARHRRIHVSTGSARTRLRDGSQHAPLMLLRRACALEAGGFGDSCAGSGVGRSSAPRASITRYREWPRFTLTICTTMGGGQFQSAVVFYSFRIVHEYSSIHGEYA